MKPIPNRSALRVRVLEFLHRAIAAGSSPSVGQVRGMLAGSARMRAEVTAILDELVREGAIAVEPVAGPKIQTAIRLRKDGAHAKAASR